MVVGVGTEPSVELMAGTGLDQGSGIPVEPTLETAVPGVFAIGDVAHHDHPVFGPVRVEHFDNAVKMGVAAARNVLGAGEVFDDPHWFWSDQYDAPDPDGGVRADVGPDGGARVASRTVRSARSCSIATGSSAGR